MRCAVLAVVAACGGPHAAGTPSPLPREGMAITLYRGAERGYGVVEDRRIVEVAGGRILLDRIDPAAALQSVVIEALGEPLHVDTCVRERIDDSALALARLAEAHGERTRRVSVLPGLHDEDQRVQIQEVHIAAVEVDPAVLSPLVRCHVTARDGRYFVRVLHVTSAFAFETRHDLALVEPGRATVTTRFAFATPSWSGTRALLSVFEGMPGDATPPRMLARETVVLDGSTSILVDPPRVVTAQLRAVYRGIALEDTEDPEPDDIVWGRGSHHRVWQWLELAVPLARGPVRAHVAATDAARDLEIEAPLIEHGADGTTRFPLWIDEDLFGTRTRVVDRADGVRITDRFDLAVANLGATPREVWVEEPLRMPKPRRLVLGRERPQIVGDHVRAKLAIAPGKTERVRFSVDYDVGRP